MILVFLLSRAALPANSRISAARYSITWRHKLNFCEFKLDPEIEFNILT